MLAGSGAECNRGRRRNRTGGLKPAGSGRRWRGLSGDGGASPIRPGESAPAEPGWPGAYSCEQRRQADQLLEVGVQRPLLANYYHGVFEFIIRGRLRPIYLRESFDPPKRKTWDSVLRQTAGAPLDVLFSTERLVLDHDSTDREALRRFLEAVAASGRPIEIRRELRTAGSQPAFVLVRLAATPLTSRAKRPPRPSLDSR